MVDSTQYVGSAGEIYIRLRNAGNDEVYDRAPAFLRRVAVYATYKSFEILVHIKPAPYAKTREFAAESVCMRTW